MLCRYGWDATTYESWRKPNPTFIGSVIRDAVKGSTILYVNSTRFLKKNQLETTYFKVGRQRLASGAAAVHEQHSYSNAATPDMTVHTWRSVHPHMTPAG
jgi:hypothetical protein